jgi:hypothetical protein
MTALVEVARSHSYTPSSCLQVGLLLRLVVLCHNRGAGLYISCRQIFIVPCTDTWKPQLVSEAANSLLLVFEDIQLLDKELAKRCGELLLC